MPVRTEAAFLSKGLLGRTLDSDIPAVPEGVCFANGLEFGFVL